MIGFLFKKFFFDVWDNLIITAVLNLGFLLFVSLAFILLSVLPPSLSALGVVLFVVFVFALCVYICAAASVVNEVSDYRHPGLAVFAANLKGALLPAAALFAALALVVFVVWFTIPVYLGMNNLPGLAAAFFSCWICLSILASIQFYPAVYYRLGRRPLKSLKKCALIFFDNTGFCFFSLFVNVTLSALVLSCPCWPLLYLDEALRLRLFKYDWLDSMALEQNKNRYEPDWKRAKIPWRELLADEREKTGSRSLKSFIFPWKE